MGQPYQAVRSAQYHPMGEDIFTAWYLWSAAEVCIRLSVKQKAPRNIEELCPEALSTATDFRVVLENVNYIMHGGDQDTMHDATHDKFWLSFETVSSFDADQ